MNKLDEILPPYTYSENREELKKEILYWIEKTTLNVPTKVSKVNGKPERYINLDVFLERLRQV